MLLPKFADVGHLAYITDQTIGVHEVYGGNPYRLHGRSLTSITILLTVEMPSTFDALLFIHLI